MLTFGRLVLAIGDSTVLPAPSMVGWFCRLPWLGYAGGSVVPSSCHLVRAAAPVPLAALREGAQNDSTLATILCEPADVALVGRWPRCGAPVLPPHDAL